MIKFYMMIYVFLLIDYKKAVKNIINKIINVLYVNQIIYLMIKMVNVFI